MKIINYKHFLGIFHVMKKKKIKYVKHKWR